MSPAGPLWVLNGHFVEGCRTLGFSGGSLLLGGHSQPCQGLQCMMSCFWVLGDRVGFARCPVARVWDTAPVLQLDGLRCLWLSKPWGRTGPLQIPAPAVSLQCDTAVMPSASVTLPITKPPKLACAEPQHLPTSSSAQKPVPAGSPMDAEDRALHLGRGSRGAGAGQRVPQIAA